MSKKILITGAGGYIGSVACCLLLKEGFEIVGIDNFSTGYKEPLQKLQKEFGEEKIRYYEADLRGDLSFIFEKEKDIEAVIHFGAALSVNESMKDPQKYFSNNVCGSQNLLSTMLDHGIKKIVFSSTCAVYGESEYLPVDEKHPTNPTNVYGASKRMIEEIIQWYSKTKDLQYVVLRYFNICGASDDSEFGDSKKPSVHLMQNVVRGALGIEKFYLTCPKVDTPDGSPIRDYINVVDLDRAHVKALEYLLKGGESEIINLGTGEGNSVLEIVRAVEKSLGVSIDVPEGETRQGEYGKVVASIKKAKKVLNWEPEHTLDDSINSLVSWYKKYPNGYPE